MLNSLFVYAVIRYFLKLFIALKAEEIAWQKAERSSGCLICSPFFWHPPPPPPHIFIVVWSARIQILKGFQICLYQCQPLLPCACLGKEELHEIGVSIIIHALRAELFGESSMCWNSLFSSFFVHLLVPHLAYSNHHDRQAVTGKVISS